MLPMQKLLERRLEAARQADDVQEIARLRRCSDSVVLEKSMSQNYKVDVLSGEAFNSDLQRIADSLGLANQIRNLRDKGALTRTCPSRADVIRHISEQIYLRSTGLALWKTRM